LRSRDVKFTVSTVGPYGNLNDLNTPVLQSGLRLNVAGP
jgi:hypothetical protein